MKPRQVHCITHAHKLCLIANKKRETHTKLKYVSVHGINWLIIYITISIVNDKNDVWWVYIESMACVNKQRIYIYITTQVHTYIHTKWPAIWTTLVRMNFRSRWLVILRLHCHWRLPDNFLWEGLGQHRVWFSGIFRRCCILGLPTEVVYFMSNRPWLDSNLFLDLTDIAFIRTLISWPESEQ